MITTFSKAKDALLLALIPLTWWSLSDKLNTIDSKLDPITKTVIIHDARLGFQEVALNAEIRRLDSLDEKNKSQTLEIAQLQIKVFGKVIQL